VQTTLTAFLSQQSQTKPEIEKTGAPQTTIPTPLDRRPQPAQAAVAATPPEKGRQTPNPPQDRSEGHPPWPRLECNARRRHPAADRRHCGHRLQFHQH